jgi:hypothetical protein
VNDPTTHPPFPNLRPFAREAVRACEVYCVAGCCGFDAFDVNREHILRWYRENDPHALWHALEQLTDAIRWHDSPAPADFDGAVDELDFWWDSFEGRAAFLGDIRAEVICAIEIVTRRPVFDPAWRTSTSIALAEGIYADRAFDRLPILADALEDAGCGHPDVLAHCRGDGPHARGC